VTNTMPSVRSVSRLGGVSNRRSCALPSGSRIHRSGSAGSVTSRH
jgi:hypothetical protein